MIQRFLCPYSSKANVKNVSKSNIPGTDYTNQTKQTPANHVNVLLDVYHPVFNTGAINHNHNLNMIGSMA